MDKATKYFYILLGFIAVCAGVVAFASLYSSCNNKNSSNQVIPDTIGNYKIQQLETRIDARLSAMQEIVDSSLAITFQGIQEAEKKYKQKRIERTQETSDETYRYNKDKLKKLKIRDD